MNQTALIRRDNEDKTALEIDLCSEDIPSLIRAASFTTNEVITSGKASTRQAKKDATTPQVIASFPGSPG